MTKTTTIILVFLIGLAGLGLAFFEYWLDLTNPWGQVLAPIEQTATFTGPTSASTNPLDELPKVQEKDWPALLEKVLLEQLGQGYKIMRQGQCGEVIAVKHNGGEMAISQAADLKWSVYSIDKAVILKKAVDNYQPIFSLAPLEMKNSQGEIIVKQKEAEHGYGFGIITNEDGWSFEAAMLGESGQLASEAVSVYWHSGECGYAVLFGGEQVD